MDDTTTRRPPVARIAGQASAQPAPPPEALEPIASGNGVVDVEMSDDEKLDRIFSAKDVKRAEEDIHIKSLGMTITIRELTQRELDDIFEMFEDRTNSRSKGRKRRVSEINAFMVSRAIVRPDFTTDKARQGLLQLYGTALLYEALPRIFKPLEVTAIAERVLALSGGDEDAITVAENL